MERDGSNRLLDAVPRVIAIVLAVIIIAVSTGTIVIISNNDFVELEQDNRPTGVHKDLQNLIYRSQSAAGGLIFLSVAVIIGEAVALILAIIDFQCLKLVMQVIDIQFSFLMALFYVVTGIACAVFAAAWAEPPEPCHLDSIGCNSGALTATNALSTGFSFIQAAVLGAIGFVIIHFIDKSRNFNAWRRL